MNFEVESKYPLDIFKNNNFEVSWNTIKVGLDLNRLTLEEISKFAMQYLERYPNLVNEYISELIFGIKKEDISYYIVKIFESLNLKIPKKNTPEWNKEWYKWRYCIVNEMVKHISNDEKLLESIEGVYADFGYPEDMSSFIYYMPQKENNAFIDPQIARSNLVSKVKKFLVKEKERLIANGDFNSLPNGVEIK